MNRRSVLGERHPDTAESLDWIGIVCNALDDVRGALESASPALSIRLEASGETHPETLSSRVDVATALINVQKKTLADQVVIAGLKHAPEHRELRRLKSPLDGKPTPRPSTPSKRKR